MYIIDSTVSTTDANVTTIQEIDISTDKVLGLTVDITAIDQNQQSAYFSQKTTFKNDNVTVTQIGSIKNVFRNREDTDWNVSYSISGTIVSINVAGELEKEIDWTCRTYIIPEEN